MVILAVKIACPKVGTGRWLKKTSYNDNLSRGLSAKAIIGELKKAD